MQSAPKVANAEQSSASSAPVHEVETSLSNVVTKLLTGDKVMTVKELLPAINSTLESKVTTSQVNSVLYKMASQKMLLKITTVGVYAPQWKLNPVLHTIDAKANEKDDQLFKAIIIKALTGNNIITPTSQILTIVNAQSGIAAINGTRLNKLLYAMERGGVVKKFAEADGTKPRWALTSTNDCKQSTLNLAMGTLSIAPPAAQSVLNIPVTNTPAPSPNITPSIPVVMPPALTAL